MIQFNQQLGVYRPMLVKVMRFPRNELRETSTDSYLLLFQQSLIALQQLTLADRLHGSQRLQKLQKIAI